MSLRRSLLIAVGLVLGLATPVARAGHGHWGVGVHIGAPLYFHPWYPSCDYYYSPYPVYAAPAPVVVQPAPVVQPMPVAQAVPQPAPVVRPAYATQAADAARADISRNLSLLNDPSENTRAECVLQLGRLHAEQAVDPVAATLAGDRSPLVREAAARALGLIGSPRALPALQRAAQADADRDVRHSAQFAMDVIQARN